MTITTEEAEARCQELLDCWHGQPATIQWPYRVLHDAVGTIRTLAAERDIANEQIYGLAEEREKWKERAERAEAKTERLRTAFRVNALRWNPEMSHAEIDAEIDRAALEGGDNADQQT